MHQQISIEENGIHLIIEVAEDGDVHLLHFSPNPYSQSTQQDNAKNRFRMVELQVSGENQDDHHGMKHTGTTPGGHLKYVGHRDYCTRYGHKLEIEMEACGLRAVSHLQFFDDIPVIRSWTEVINIGAAARGMEYISSFALTGIDKEGSQGWAEKSRLHIGHNTWYGEAQWRQYSLTELGLYPATDFSMKPIRINNTGTWSTCEYLPMGCYENTEVGTSLIWQIENNGSWHWEIGDVPGGHLYLQLSGPTEAENHWWKNLLPGKSFTSVPIAVGVVSEGFDKAVGELTKYRRAIRRPNEDDEKLPVIFNDYMNCLFGDPTTEKLLPLIDAAAEAGCEYFCIDCGWYSDGYWWDGVGEWLPSKVRFPNGIKEPLDYIRSRGMIPGLWLELEVMGIRCPLADQVPNDWFFMRHGNRVIDHGRYQLDYRNPAVREHADEVVDRLVNEYGAGYIKMDYNIDAGIGTEIGADSFGDGLLGHNRAYLAWLDSLFMRYPDLVIENCGSGGMRMDYALLERYSIQSSSDQTDYRKNAVIAASCPSAVTPEQCAVWSYPLRDGDREETIFNMVNAMLLRIHQSGHLAELSTERFALVKEGIACYKSIRSDIKTGIPFWPLGLPTFTDGWISLGLNCGDKFYLAVWRLDGPNDSCDIFLEMLKGKNIMARCIYPQGNEWTSKWSTVTASLTVHSKKPYTARLFEIVEVNPFNF